VTPDMQRALAMFNALDLDSDRVHCLVIPGAPWSKARPRFGHGRTYKTKEDTDAQARTALYLRNAIRQQFTGNVAMGCVFYRPNRQRIDTDNLLKHISDAATGVVWEDDSQCTAVMGILEYDPDNPRTVVMFGTHISSLKRGTDSDYPCEVCGALISLKGQTLPRRACSPACSQALRGRVSLADPIPCRQCNKPFKRTTRTNVFCSDACRVASMVAKNRSKGKPLSKCSDCGVQLAHYRGGRCRNCWRVSTLTRKVS